jgi:hypothetical protein
MNINWLSSGWLVRIWAISRCKVRGAPGIGQAQLTIEDCRLRRQLTEGLDHARQTVGVFSTVARIPAHLAAVFDDPKLKPSHLGSCSQSSPLGGLTAAEGERGRTNARRTGTREI